MVDTIKFSQMTNVGNINNNDIMPSLRTGENVILNNPWTFLPPGTTAQRPAPSSTINYRMRFNTDEQLYEYYDATLGVWTQIQENSMTPGPFITYTADASLPDAQNLGLLADGILKQTISTGVATLNIAVNGTDYYGPGFVIPGADGGTGINNGALTINLGSATTGFVMTSDSSGNATWQSVAASGAITTIDGDSGSATALAGVVTISGASTGLTFAGASHTLSLGGLLNPTFGGLGVSNPTAHGILVGEGASAVTPIVLGAGQILIGTTAGDPVAAAISSGTNILVQNSSGAITVGITGVIAPTNGGTGVNNGASTLTLGGSLTTSGAFSSTFTMTGITGVTFPTSGTLATTSQLPTPSALTKTDDINVTLTLGGSPSVALLAATSLTLGWNGQLSLARGGTNANLTAANGAIPYSTATSIALLAPGSSGQLFQSGGMGSPNWTIATYPSSTTISQILYSSANNTVTGLSTVNGAVLRTDLSGVPLFSTTLPSGLALQTPASGNLSNCTFETGQFTPTIGGSSVDPSAITYAFQIGEYTKIGNVVYYYMRIIVSALTIGSASGQLQLRGLPYSAINQAANDNPGTVLLQNTTIDVGTLYIVGRVVHNTNYIGLSEIAATGGSSVTIAVGNITSSSDITVSGFYFVS